MAVAGKARAHIASSPKKAHCGQKITARSAVISIELAEIRLQRGVGQQPCAKCLKTALTRVQEAKATAPPRLDLVEIPAAGEAPVTWSWPSPLNEVSKLMRAVRGGFTLVELKQPNSAPASAEPVYRLRREGRTGPSTLISGDTVAVARRRGLIEHDQAHLQDDGATPFKLGPLAL